MSHQLTFHADGRWRGGGTIPPALRRIPNLFDWLKVFLAEVTDLKQHYIRFTRLDGALIGQEKASLVQEIDDLLAGLFRLRQHLTPGGPPMFCSTETIDRHRFRVEVRSTTWNGEGRAYPWPLEAGEDFMELHNEQIIQNLKKLFMLYGDAVADGIITESETNEILVQLDMVAFALLRAEFFLLKGSLDS